MKLFKKRAQQNSPDFVSAGIYFFVTPGKVVDDSFNNIDEFFLFEDGNLVAVHSDDVVKGAKVVLLGGDALALKNKKKFIPSLSNNFLWCRWKNSFYSGVTQDLLRKHWGKVNILPEASFWLDSDKDGFYCCLWRLDNKNVMLSCVLIQEGEIVVRELLRTSDQTVDTTLKTILGRIDELKEVDLIYSAVTMEDSGSTAATAVAANLKKKYKGYGFGNFENKGSVLFSDILNDEKNGYRKTEYLLGLIPIHILYTVFCFLFAASSLWYGYQTVTTYLQLNQLTIEIEKQEDEILLTNDNIQSLLRDNLRGYTYLYGINADTAVTFATALSNLRTAFSVEVAGNTWTAKGQFDGGRVLVKSKEALLKNKLPAECTLNLDWSKNWSVADVEVKCQL